MAEWSDKELGLHLPIARRDFIGGVAVGAALAAAPGALAQAATAAPAAASADYPPALTGLRGQYPGSFETAHMARDGDFTGALAAEDADEHYDLVIVGGGISGLAAAYFYRQALGDDRKILILDNHDDFGGHAKRNEFTYEGRKILAYGGTMSIESPFPYSFTSKKLMADLGVDLTSYHRYETKAYDGLGSATFFDKEHFLADKLVTGTGTKPWPQFFAEAPLTGAVRADLTRLYTEKKNYLPDLGPDARAEYLRHISYQDYLVKHAGVLPASLPFFFGHYFRNNKRVDTLPAWEAALGGRMPGFAGMDLPEQITAEAQHFHWPDGNATVARLLVGRLVPGVFPTDRLDQESVVLAPARYAALDNPANPTRIRLSSMVIRAEHIGKPARQTEKAVRIVYVKDGKRVSVTGANCIMACFNMVIPFIVPELPQAQKEALHYASKVPMQYTNVLLKNWRPWAKLGVKSIGAPNGYHIGASLDTPMNIGGYASALTPDEPVVIHMTRNPNQPGLPRKEQNRLGRAAMLAEDYTTIEREIRSQLQRMLGGAGFNAARDIAAITVNRWPHGYAYTYDTLGDPDVPDELRPHVIGRQTFGRIAIANADAAGSAFTNTAIDMGERAVQECLISRGLI
jgi:spermidine dehydrogenase